MTDQAFDAAADILWTSWREGRKLPDGLPAEVRPQSRADGYAIQARAQKKGGAAVFGWKIAATSAGGQKHIGVDGPLAGRLMADRVFQPGAEISLRNNLMRVAEPEFAFRMKRGLPAKDKPYTVAEVMDAVDTLHPAIEIPDTRYQNFAQAGAPQLIADNAAAAYFMLGAAAPDTWRTLDLVTHKVKATIPGKTEREGTGAVVLGDPRIALTWIANELAQVGTPLEAGHVITTGTCMPPLEIAPGDTMTNDMGVLGTVTARFGD